MASVTVYEIADASDRARELLRFVARCVGAEAEAYEAEHEPLVSSRDYAAIVRKTLTQQDNILRVASDEEAEGAYTLMFSFLPRLTQQQQADVVEKVTSHIGAATESKGSAVRLRILATLYNMVDGGALKLEVLHAVIRFASDTRQLELLAPFLANLAALEKAWAATPQQLRKLYLLLSTVLERAGDAEQSQVFLIRYLSTFEGDAGMISLDEAKEGAKKAAIGYIKAPAISQRSNLPNLVAVKAMATDPRYAKVHALLSIFASGDLDQYTAFHAGNAELIASLGVDHAASMETMRLLTLCTLAGSRPTLSYADVAAALKVEASEVESWIVRAIARGLLDARMDQMTSTVTITRTTQRHFGADEWRALSTKLHAWRDNVASLLSKVEAAM